MTGFNWLEPAVLLLIVASVAAGVVGAIVTTWSLRATIYSLEDRISVVEGITQREVKIRAGQARQMKTPKDEELLKDLRAAPVSRQPNWWERVSGNELPR
jgi:hypothetical protein